MRLNVAVLSIYLLLGTSGFALAQAPRIGDMSKPAPRASQGAARPAQMARSFEHLPATTAIPHQTELPEPLVREVISQGTLSLSDLEAIALKHNPTLAQAAAHIDGSRGAALEAGLYPNPIMGYQG